MVISKKGKFSSCRESIHVSCGLARSLIATPTQLSRFVMHNIGVQVSKTYCITLMSAVLNGCVLPPTSKQDSKQDSHIACRSPAMPCHAAPLPCSDGAVSFVKVRVIAGNIRIASPTV
jgi:hypothetical protein